LTTWFYSINATLGLALVTALCVAFACGGHVLVRRTFRRADFIEYNEVAGFVVAVIGVLYAVLIAFVTVIVWQHYQDSDERAQTEVNATTDIWRFAKLLPAASSRQIRGDVARYVSSIVTDEWPKMRRGEESAQAQRDIVTLIDDIGALDVRSQQQANIQNHLLDRVQIAADLRRHRIYDTGSGIPLVLWVVLVVGAVTIIGFVYLFGLKHFHVQLLMTASIGILIGLSFGLILELDYPFRGDVSVTAARWVELQAIIARGE
jgi:Protein of unknown function (DUF4239)